MQTPYAVENAALMRQEIGVLKYIILVPARESLKKQSGLMKMFMQAVGKNLNLAKSSCLD